MSNNTARDNATAGPELRNPVVALVFGVVMVFGLPLNAVSLWIMLRHHSLRSVVFLVNLAISDILLVVSLPMRVFFYATGTWPLGTEACALNTMLFRNNIRSSSIFITLISVDRMLALVYPLRTRHLRTSANAWRAVALIWLLVFVLNVPEGVMFRSHLNKWNGSICFELKGIRDRVGPNSFFVFYSVLLLAMLAVNVVCTALVSWTLHGHLKISGRVVNRLNVMLIFAMNLMMFTVFFLPISLVSFIEDLRPFATPLICLASVNCCLDPLLYYFSFDGFWKKKEDVERKDCDNNAQELV